MRRLCIIPARAGSKGFPSKNLAKLAGKSLIVHAVERAAIHFDKVIFSSDSVEYLEIIERLELENVICASRPQDLATDTATLNDVAVHYFKQYKKHFQQIWLHLPTCPLLDTKDFEDVANILDHTECDGVVTVTQLDYSPYFAMQFDENERLIDWHESKPRQDNRPLDPSHYKQVYRPNGAYYAMWMKSFEGKRSFFKGNIQGHIMPRIRSVDIQTVNDLKTSEALWDSYKCVQL